MHFAGYPAGAMTGMWVAAEYPDRVARLVLANAPARIPLARTVFDQRIETARTGGYPETARDA